MLTPNLSATLSFLAALTRHRLSAYFPRASRRQASSDVPSLPETTETEDADFQETAPAAIFQDFPMPPIPVLEDDDHPFTRLVLDKGMTVDEYVVLAVSLAHHLQPDFFDALVSEFIEKGHDFLPIGGIKTPGVRTFLPTGETALFLLAGTDLERRVQVMRLLDQDHYFSREKILSLEAMRAGEPESGGRLILDPEWVERILFGKIKRPRFSSTFPAERVETQMDWEDLVLLPQTLEEVKELMTWLKHGQSLLHEYGMGKRLKPGYRALFYGPPGTGKTLTAGLLGKHSGRDVFKIDLSMVVSKFIGETEKNLSTLFDRAENKDWILFFDEADALFGKRTNVRDAHDKYANQEVSYLLQRVENYNGLVILATNFKSNIDEAFTRRFQSIIHFPMPRAGERLLLWQKAFPPAFNLNGLNLNALSQKYELSGASILNVVQFAGLRALERGDGHIKEQDVREGVVKEFNKEGKIVS